MCFNWHDEVAAFEIRFCPNKVIKLQVAIKKMKKKYYSWEECVNLREVKVSHLDDPSETLFVIQCLIFCL